MEMSDKGGGFSVNTRISNPSNFVFVAGENLISRAHPILEPMLVICSAPPRLEEAKERRRLLLLVVASTHVSN